MEYSAVKSAIEAIGRLFARDPDGKGRGSAAMITLAVHYSVMQDRRKPGSGAAAREKLTRFIYKIGWGFPEKKQEGGEII